MFYIYTCDFTLVDHAQSSADQVAVADYTNRGLNRV